MKKVLFVALLLGLSLAVGNAKDIEATEIATNDVSPVTNPNLGTRDAGDYLYSVMAESITGDIRSLGVEHIGSPGSWFTTGARDLAVLAIAVSGFMIAGPLELFLPEAVAAVLGGWVWVPLIMLYGLVTTLMLLLMRPRLVVYNISALQLRPLLERAGGCGDP